MLRLLLAAVMTVPLTAAVQPEAVQKELDRYDDAIAKLLKTYEEGLAKERAKSIPILAAAAKKTLGSGDMPGAVEAWKCVLRLDRGHADARAFFTSINQLDQVLADLGGESRSPAVDALGDPLPQGNQGSVEPRLGKAVERLVTVKADDQHGMELGALKKGSVLTLSYVEGTWTFRKGVRPAVSPDAVEADPRVRLAIFGQDDRQIAVVQPGSQQNPWSWTFTADEPNARLRFALAHGPNPEGETVWKVRLQAAK